MPGVTEPVNLHQPVMPDEVLAALDPRPGQIAVDCTVGTGGHARLLAERLAPSGRLIGLDCDAEMLDIARRGLAGLPVTLVHAPFDRLADVLRDLEIPAVDAVLADLGICSAQLDDPSRGFSFQADAPLDMRLDRGQGEPASELLARLPERELADLIFAFGEERFSRRIARRIVAARSAGGLHTTGELADLVRRCVPRSRGSRIDPATRTFQALRIAVNDELGALDRLLAHLPACVKPTGRVAIISFHSLEDRRVKLALRTEAWIPGVKKPIVAGDAEVAINPRARSAKLRWAIRKQ